MALRGHRDYATLDAVKKGNFHASLQFRIDAGDHQLKDHLETRARNPKLVRTLILTSSSALFKDYIQDAIISEVKTQSQGLLYTVEADEVTDVSN